jgi:hypothetical protein
MHEAVLTALRAAGIDLQVEQLAPDEEAQARLQRLAIDAADRRQARQGERLAEHRRVGDEAPVGGFERIEAAGDQRAERVGDRKLAELPHRAVGGAVALQAPFRDESPDRLHRVERDPVGAGEDGPDRGLGEARHEAVEEGPHRRVGQRLESQLRQVPGLRPPVRPPVGELRSGQGDHEERDTPRPFEEVLDEVEEAGVGPLEVLEEEHGRAPFGDPLEEDPPGGEEDVPAAGGSGLEPQQREERGLHPAPVLVGRDVLGDGAPDPLARRRLVVVLGEPLARRTISPSAQKVIPSP